MQVCTSLQTDNHASTPPSTDDYIMARQEDEGNVRNVKVISSEEYVPKHKLLVMDMYFKATLHKKSA